MKKTVKFFLILAVLSVVFLIVLSFSEESFDLAKVEDVTWGIDSINGLSYEEHCKAYDLDPETANSFWTIRKDRVAIETDLGTSEYPIEVTGKGFLLSLTDDYDMDVTYNEGDDSLTYVFDNGKGKLKTVMVPYE